MHAPPLDDATTWLNSPPLTRDDLHGHVVAYDFWTYTCVNWLRTLPYVRAWGRRYRDHGLIVVGVHTPEFGFEHDLANVQPAVDTLGVDYPVVLDSDYEIWRAFDNHYWPALYVADADGVIRHHHFGEGGYDEGERALQEVLVAAGVTDVPQDLVAVAPAGVEIGADWDVLDSPETYLGSGRGIGPADGVPDALPLNRWALAGDWRLRPDGAFLESGVGRIAFCFRARDVNLVLASSEGEVPFHVTIDGEPPGSGHGSDCDADGNGVLSRPRLYQLVRQHDRSDARVFEITFRTPGVGAYVFTFG